MTINLHTSYAYGWIISFLTQLVWNRLANNIWNYLWMSRPQNLKVSRIAQWKCTRASDSLVTRIHNKITDKMITLFITYIMAITFMPFMRKKKLKHFLFVHRQTTDLKLSLQSTAMQIILLQTMQISWQN